tara:strand:- start:1306 stop:2346 length:1041 start_codon:yes stop_codon:yes gene_type:complete
MIYDIIKTFFLLGNTTHWAPAQKAIEITYVIIYPAFIIMSVIAIHVTIDLYRLCFSPFQAPTDLKFTNNIDSTKHLDSITRVVIDSMVYTIMVTLWGNFIKIYKNKSLQIVNTLLSISNNFQKIYISDIFTLLILFSLYFDSHFYITTSSCMLIGDLILKRYKTIYNKDPVVDSVTEENVSLFYKNYAEKPYKYVKKIIVPYFKPRTEEYSKIDIPIYKLEIFENKESQGNIIKLISTVPIANSDATNFSSYPEHKSMEPFSVAVYYNRDIVINEFQQTLDKADSDEEPTEWLTTQHLTNHTIVCYCVEDNNVFEKNNQSKFMLHLDINMCIILETTANKNKIKIS